MNKVNVMLGSSYNLPHNLSEITGPWVGADHGNITLLTNNIIPQIGVGDYDSLTRVERNWLEAQVDDLRYAKPEKDFTDSQAAVKIALRDLHADQVDLYGATGGRIDHELVNLCLPLDFQPQDAQKLRLLDNQNVITYFAPGTYQIQNLTQDKYLGFYNLVPVQHFWIQDAKYPLKPTDLMRPVSLSSNEFVGAVVKFGFTSGLIAVIQCHD